MNSNSAEPNHPKIGWIVSLATLLTIVTKLVTAIIALIHLVK